MKQLMLGVLALAVVAACDSKKSSPAQPASSGSTASAPAASVDAAPPKPKAPWYVGSWQGSYDAQHYLIDMDRKLGAIRDWKEDDGGGAAGKGKLSFAMDERGTITGTASGPLGEQVASGEVDEEVFRVKLSPKEPGEQSFLGTLVARRKGDALEGRLQASSGNSRVVRDAPVTLSSGGSPPPGE